MIKKQFISRVLQAFRPTRLTYHQNHLRATSATPIADSEQTTSMSQPHPLSEHPSNPPFDPPTPHTHNHTNNHHNHTHIPSTAFSGPMAKNYNQRTGGCNILLANHLLNLITPSLPSSRTQPLRILDNACGPMVLTTQCLLHPSITAYQDVHISAVDISADFIAANLAALSSSPTAAWNSAGRKVDTAIMDGTSLQFPPSTFDLSLTSLALFAFPDPTLGARELHRTLKPNGVTAATTWKRVDWLPLLHRVESLLKPGHAQTRLPFLEPWSVPGKLASVLRAGGFSRVEEGEVEVVAWWGGVAEAAFWITATVKMMVGSGWTEGEKEGMEAGFREVLERGVKEGDGGLVLRGEGGRVGFRMVAFVGVGWK